MSIKADIQSLSPTAEIELFELDATNLPEGEKSYFHAGTNELSRPIIWQGITYSPLPVEASGFDITTNGTLPRPRFRVANIGGVFSAVAEENDDLVGCKVTRRRTLAKYLDDANWIFRTATAQGGTATTLTLDSLASDVDGMYVGNNLYLLSGAGSVQSSRIISYDGTTKIATVEPWKQNMLKHSNDASQSSWFKNQTTVTWDAAEQASKLSVTSASDPYCGQNISINPKGRTITFTVDVKGVGTGIGKILHLYLYRSTPSGDITSKGFVITGNWQTCTFTKTFDNVDGSLMAARFDFPQTGATVGDQCLFRNAHVYEGEFSEYVSTGASGVFLPNSTTGFEIRHPDYGQNQADPTQQFPDDIWFVEQKLNENKYVVEWELASVFDLEGIMLPHRQVIQDSCPWRYRGAECGYTGTVYFDANDQPTTESADVCGKHLSSCKARFGNEPLPFGGFPGAVRFVA